MTIATWDSWVESPKSTNLKHVIIDRCKQLNITVGKMVTEDLNGDFLDRLLGNRKEIIYFTLRGDIDSLKLFRNELLKLETND
jgi:hypothetical protein